MSALEAMLGALATALPQCRVSIEPHGAAIYLEFRDDGHQLTLSIDRRIRYALADDISFAREAALAVSDALASHPGERNLALDYDDGDRLRVQRR